MEFPTLYSSSSTIPTQSEQLFNQLLKKAHELNHGCVSLSHEFKKLVGHSSLSQNREVNQGAEVMIKTLKRVKFQALSNEEDEKVFVLRVQGESNKIELSSLDQCFFGNNWKNMLRISVPFGVDFQDLTQELAVYELLDARKEKGVEELRGLVDGLERVEEELKERVERVKKEEGLGLRARRLLDEKLNQGRTCSTMPDGAQELEEEVFFEMNEREVFVKRLRLEFEIEVSDERAIVELENFERMIEQYYEVSNNQQEVKGRSEREKKQRDTREEGRKKGFNSSTVISSQQDKDLVWKWLEESRGTVNKTSLLFRGTRDGFSSQQFHNLCDEKGPTVVLFRTTTGRRGGGYSNVSWHSRAGSSWTEDSERKSFLFSLENQTRYNYKGQTGHAIQGHSSFGPVFGGGADLFLSSNCDKNTYSKSNPQSYLLPNDSHLAGSPNFQVEEYEVWKIE